MNYSKIYIDLIDYRLAFTETCLKDDVCDLFSMPGFIFWKIKDQLNGGVAKYTRDDIQFVHRHNPTVFDNHMEYLVKISKDSSYS